MKYTTFMTKSKNLKNLEIIFLSFDVPFRNLICPLPILPLVPRITLAFSSSFSIFADKYNILFNAAVTL